MESRNFHTYYMYVKPLDEGFIIPLIYFLVFWLLVFEILYRLIWASYTSHKMCMKEENNRKETIWLFLMTRTKFLWALKSTAEKIMPKNWKKKSDITCITSFPILALFYNVGVFSMFHCPNKVKWHNYE